MKDPNKNPDGTMRGDGDLILEGLTATVIALSELTTQLKELTIIVGEINVSVKKDLMPL
ncbi:MAG: hypothetical protein ACRDSJ_10545 [Rubrobacteraceae bacterium]